MTLAAAATATVTPIWVYLAQGGIGAAGVITGVALTLWIGHRQRKSDAASKFDKELVDAYVEFATAATQMAFSMQEWPGFRLLGVSALQGIRDMRRVGLASERLRLLLPTDELREHVGAIGHIAQELSALKFAPLPYLRMMTKFNGELPVLGNPPTTRAELRRRIDSASDNYLVALTRLRKGLREELGIDIR